VCLKDTGCYTERQREEIDKDENRACPNCANQTANQKQKRSRDFLDKELVKVAWKPTWETEVIKEACIMPDHCC